MKTPLMLLIAALTFSCSAFATGNDTLRLGIDPSYPPMDAKAPDGSVKGFDVDLGNEICRRIHAHCQWVELEFSGMIPALQARKIDAIMSSMAITEKREQQILFSSKLFQFKSHLVAKQGSGLSDAVASLKGKQIGVQSGTQFETYAQAHWAPNGVNIVAYKSQDEVFTDLVNGRLDGALLGTVEADQGFLRTPAGKGFAFVGAPLSMGDRGVGIGLRKDETALQAAINSAIASMLQDGTYAKIAHKYFDFDPYGGN
ncbi:transporter substrate-binding domain-containing protein [Paraburkholderia phenazinium]|jgi:lysine/arginine/ornithine transport system substrate-binding protein|uniref:Lysine-arginine-ornithine-binding protein n=1 Tax=Paraburkholderia phenazinium TaxID=60549 RepID=A0A1G8ICD9_9BURK|nr:transporter substrate-binding domain-containing protein [Paraburkholderia phenazinium]SDI16595.1 lysine-arginine-ornithine-binding protein [Paraburkholderia phenazinium]